jgi:hypothetical protein
MQTSDRPVQQWQVENTFEPSSNHHPHIKVSEPQPRPARLAFALTPNALSGVRVLALLVLKRDVMTHRLTYLYT